ncbi:hypothetical protein BKA80DRAFT_300391 [Phyllosticta citrichinensis]
MACSTIASIRSGNVASRRILKHDDDSRCPPVLRRAVAAMLAYLTGCRVVVFETRFLRRWEHKPTQPNSWARPSIQSIAKSAPAALMIITTITTGDDDDPRCRSPIGLRLGDDHGYARNAAVASELSTLKGATVGDSRKIMLDRCRQRDREFQRTTLDDTPPCVEHSHSGACASLRHNGGQDCLYAQASSPKNPEN